MHVRWGFSISSLVSDLTYSGHWGLGNRSFYTNNMYIIYGCSPVIYLVWVFQSCMWTQTACILKDIDLNMSLFEVYFCFCSDRSIMLYDLRVSSPARKLIMRVSLIIYQLKVKCMVMILDLLFTFFDDLHQHFCCLGKVNRKMTSDSPPSPLCKEINSSMFIVHWGAFLSLLNPPTLRQVRKVMIT